MAELLSASWSAFQNNAVSFVVETTYLDWNTSFPAVSVCENESPGKLYESGKRLFGVKRNMNLDFYLRDIAFFEGTCFACKSQCGKTMNCSEDYNHLVRNVRSECEELLHECTWNKVPFNCCKQFLPLETEMGVCFTINSVYNSKGKPQMNLISNHWSGPGRLDFKVSEPIRLLLHSQDDVPYINHPQEEKITLDLGTIFSLTFLVKEIENDASVQSGVSVEQRQCRFPDENNLSIYSHYSYSACIVDCRAKAQVDYCNCTHHFMPRLAGVKICDIAGLACLTRFSEILRSLRTQEANKQGLYCNCMSSCTEPEYTVVSQLETVNEETGEVKYGSSISLVMGSLPNERFKRNAVRTSLDLVVSMGGTVGLFLGASLLSTVEIFYYFCIRKRTLPELQFHTSVLQRRANLNQELKKFMHLKRNIILKGNAKLVGRKNMRTNLCPYPYLS